jgi:hypothetical protein
MQDDRAASVSQQDRGQQTIVDLADWILPEGGLQPGPFCSRNNAAKLCGDPRRVLADQHIMKRPERHGPPMMGRDM